MMNRLKVTVLHGASTDNVTSTRLKLANFRTLRLLQRMPVPDAIPSNSHQLQLTVQIISFDESAPCDLGLNFTHCLPENISVAVQTVTRNRTCRLQASRRPAVQRPSRRLMCRTVSILQLLSRALPPAQQVRCQVRNCCAIVIGMCYRNCCATGASTLLHSPAKATCAYASHQHYPCPTWCHDVCCRRSSSRKADTGDAIEKQKATDTLSDFQMSRHLPMTRLLAHPSALQCQSF